MRQSLSFPPQETLDVLLAKQFKHVAQRLQSATREHDASGPARGVRRVHEFAYRVHTQECQSRGFDVDSRGCCWPSAGALGLVAARVAARSLSSAHDSSVMAWSRSL